MITFLIRDDIKVDNTDNKMFRYQYIQMGFKLANAVPNANEISFETVDACNITR